MLDTLAKALFRGPFFRPQKVDRKTPEERLNAFARNSAFWRQEPIPGGHIQLLNTMGDELDIVNAARLSYDKHVDSLGERDIGLLNFLLKHRHGTPFEMVEFMFQVRCPLSVAREWHRHRIASYNEISGRYVKQTQDCYNPTPDAMRTQKGKPGAYTFEPIEDPYINEYCRDIMKDHYKECYETYECLLENGVAKELARNVLPQGMFTEFRYKTNARSLMNFLSLRNAPNAMYEIRQYAIHMETMFGKIMPHTHESFVKNGRVAP